MADPGLRYNGVRFRQGHSRRQELSQPPKLKFFAEYTKVAAF